MKAIKSIFSLLLIASLVLLVPSCAVNPVTGKRQIMFVSEEQEIAMGAQYHPSVISTFGIYDNPQLQKFIQEKGNEMAKISHRPNLQYHFTILDSPVVNAFAVPGGYLYITRGILAQFNSEAELIGVLGHEMGHVTARHSAQQQTNQTIGQALLLGGMLASKEIYELADEAMAGMQLLFLSFSRENERESDRLGVEYATKIGYDAHKMADFFQVLDKMSMDSQQAGVPTFMSTHPNPEDRFNTVHRISDEWQAKYPGKDFIVDTNDYLSMIDGIVYGEDPRQGFVENNTFYHPDLKFKFAFPTGWTLVNAPTQVQIAAPDQKAGIIFSLSDDVTPAAASQKAITNLKLSVIQSKDVKVNGSNAIEVISQQTSQAESGQQQTIKLCSYFIEKDGKVYTFHGIASDTDFNKYLSSFELTMKGFSTLTDASKLNVKPDRVRIKTVQKTSTLADAFAYFNVPKDQYKELALLNNIDLNQQLTRGKLIKVITK
ncbi:MAG: M48 family metalloprotease [Draconibacterium sp.]